MKTIIIQYGLFWRIGVIIFLTVILMLILKYWLKIANYIFGFLIKFNSKIVMLVLLPLLMFLGLFIRFDGDWSFSIFSNDTKKDNININQHLLKEILFDEIDGIITAYGMYEKSKEISYNVTLQEVKEALSLLSNGYEEDTLLPFFIHKAKGSSIKKPKHIFLIVGENYALWPLLPQYEKLPIAKNMRRILKKYDNVFIKKFLSASSGTMSSFSAIVTGLPYIGLNEKLFVNNSYETGLFPQLKAHGYKTRFFYGGSSSWASIDSFVNNQGVEETYYAPSFSGEMSVWGIDDKSLFNGIKSKIEEEPSFNLILTVSNHSPYPIDMSKEPYITSKEEMEKFIDKQVTNKDSLIQKMQHFEYMDFVICQFIETVLEKYPDSLFIITGDHAQRWHIQSNTSLYEFLNIPLIIIAKGINAKDINEKAIGSHTDIVATIMELISSKGTEYFSFGKDILHEQTLGFGEAVWMNNKVINYGWNNEQELLSSKPIEKSELEQEHKRVKAYQTIAAWRILHGLELK
ncbi:MAG: LTA synthase family protein [Elusimicrobiaceae bacterium]|nr:LTA synthase family protein [Elusimicrobiaceae bacterium]